MEWKKIVENAVPLMLIVIVLNLLLFGIVVFMWHMATDLGGSEYYEVFNQGSVVILILQILINIIIYVYAGKRAIKNNLDKISAGMVGVSIFVFCAVFILLLETLYNTDFGIISLYSDWLFLIPGVIFNFTLSYIGALWGSKKIKKKV